MVHYLGLVEMMYSYQVNPAPRDHKVNAVNVDLKEMMVLVVRKALVAQKDQKVLVVILVNVVLKGSVVLKVTQESRAYRESAASEVPMVIPDHEGSRVLKEILDLKALKEVRVRMD